MAGYRIAADIGATNARFVLAEGAAVGEVIILPTAAHPTQEALLSAAREALGWQSLEGGCIAVAGPVSDGRGVITNGGLRFDEPSLSRALGAPIRLVNDFHALATALPKLSRLRQLGGEAAVADAVKGLVGPGSGLGMSALVPGRNGWEVLPSEGGHADLAPGSPLELEVLQLLQSRLGHVSWEAVLSGPGLVNLYGAVCALWGVPERPATPEWITATGADATEPACHQTLELFFGLLGAAAGNLALTLCARGGVYVGGGIVPRLADFAAASPMRRRFDERGVLSAWAAEIPLYLILDENPGLLGALELAAGV